MKLFTQLFTFQEMLCHYTDLSFASPVFNYICWTFKKWGKDFPSVQCWYIFRLQIEWLLCLSLHNMVLAYFKLLKKIYWRGVDLQFCISFCCTAKWISFTYTYQFSSVAQSCPTLCDPVNCSTPGLPVHHQLWEFTQTHVHGVSDAIQPSHPLSSPSPPAPSPSQHQSLFHESTLRMRWPKYWSFSLSISPSNEHPGLISFRLDWLDLLAV